MKMYSEIRLFKDFSRQFVAMPASLPHPLHFLLTQQPVSNGTGKPEVHCFIQDSDTIINWTVIEEKNNDQYTVEKSEDRMTWVQVSPPKKSGSGRYTHIDRYNQSALCWYRIRVGKMFGKEDCSDAFQLKSPYASFKLKLKPNPAKSFLYLEIQESNQDFSEISVQNLLGKTMYHERNLSGRHHVVKTGHLSPGFYYLKVTLHSGAFTTKRFEKQR